MPIMDNDFIHASELSNSCKYSKSSHTTSRYDGTSDEKDSKNGFNTQKDLEFSKDEKRSTSQGKNLDVMLEIDSYEDIMLDETL